MVAKLPSKLEQLPFVRLAKSGVLHHCVRNAGVSELEVHTADLLPVHIQRQILNLGRLRQADAVVLRIDAFAGDKSRRRFDRLRFSGELMLIAVAADAARAVAAHFAKRTVAVEKQHAIIGSPLCRNDRHQAVCSDGHTPVAERSRKLGELLFVQLAAQVFHNDKVVARAVHFRKTHRLRPSPVYLHPIISKFPAM